MRVIWVPAVRYSCCGREDLKGKVLGEPILLARGAAEVSFRRHEDGVRGVGGWEPVFPSEAATGPSVSVRAVLWHGFRC